LTTALALATGHAGAQPRVGTSVPRFEGRDLLGRNRSSGELLGQPTLVAVLTHRDAGAMLPMLDRAMARYPTGRSRVRLALILALDLPFYATTSRAIDVAKREVPQAYWSNTWLDRGRHIQRAFGLPQGTRAPFVFVLDPQGRVKAVVRGVPSEADVRAIWRVLTPG
jgi:predicted transcriptional regulator